MSRNVEPIAIELDRRLLEHPAALHVHRMSAGVWIYLVLLAQIGSGPNTVPFSVEDCARRMGLPEGTIRSWLGHLRKHRYITIRHSGTSLLVAIGRSSARVASGGQPPPATRFFTLAKLEAALGETGHRDGLESALDAYDDAIVKRALAGALAVPAGEIRRSRTALFLYLLKRHADEKN